MRIRPLSRRPPVDHTAAHHFLSVVNDGLTRGDGALRRIKVPTSAAPKGDTSAHAVCGHESWLPRGAAS